MAPLALSTHRAITEENETLAKLNAADGGARKPHKVPRLSPRATWKIEVKPHIGMTMKRMFPSLKQQMGCLYLAHTPENARNLEWFNMRYPMKVNPSKTLFETAAKHRERDTMIEKLLAGTIVPVNVALIKPLREYQQQGAELAYLRRHIIIGDDVGVGKTAQAIGLMAKEGGLPCVVVTLTHLPTQWKAAIEEFIGMGLNVHVVNAGQPYDLTRRKVKGKKPATPGRLPDVILISYSKIAGWAETLAGMGIKLVVYDECQELRGGEDAARWNGAFHLSGSVDRVCGLSATPFYNYGAEFWNVAEVISPGELGTREEFISTWCVNREGKMVIEDPVAFGTYLAETGLMIRRTRKDVARELPKGEPIKVLQHVDADMKAIDRIGGSLAELAKAILKQGESFRGQKMRDSSQFDMKMRQACGIAKAPYVAEFVKLLLYSEHRVVLYGWHREVFAVWLKALKEFNPVMYTGSESPAEKDYALGRFKGGDSRILIISNRAGAGIDGLQHFCRTVVIGEFDWSPGIIEQMIGRVGRDGQDDLVTAYFMMADTIADHKMVEINGVKRQQITGVRDRHVELIEKLQTDGGYIRQMAESYLASRGIAIPEQKSNLVTMVAKTKESLFPEGEVIPLGPDDERMWD